MSVQKIQGGIEKKATKKHFSNFLILFVLLIASLLTFSACKLTNSGDTTNSSFDASGNLRLSAPMVNFNPYSSNDNDDSQFIDDYSGSFTWELSYYLSNGSEEQLKDINYDKSYYLSNFYCDAEFQEIYKYYQQGTKKPIYSKDQNAIKDYFGLSNTTIVGFDSTQAHFYGVFQEDGLTQIKRVYTAAEYVINNKGDISFPDYEIVVDGKYFTFRVTLKNLDNLVLNIDEDGMLNAYNPFADATTDNSLFTFEYRTGKSSTNVTNGNGDFLPCPSDYMTYYVDSYGRFFVRFNPRLEEGSTSRYLKVRALATATDKRADSLYSSTISFEAYSISFSAYSVNSTDLAYGKFALIYNSDKYYFHSIKTTYDSVNNCNYISSLTGVFPEGRKIVVSRESLYTDKNDYALQSWTTNAYAENSCVLENTLPSNVSGYDVIEANCIPYASKNSSAFSYISTKSDYVNPTYYVKSSLDKGLSYFVYEHLYGVKEATSFTADDEIVEVLEVDNNKNITKALVKTETLDDAGKTATRGDLVVVSHYKLNGYKFYSNFAKVRNFKASGTFFAGDNFFTGNDQYLSGVTVSVFNVEGKRICYVNSSVNSSETVSIAVLETIDTKVTRTHPIDFVFDGAYFTITGLEHGDYLYFEKEGQPLVQDIFTSNSTNLPYSFHSSYMEKVFIEYLGGEFKVLNLHPSENLYSDRQEIGIIGTQYAEESNLVVNLYQITSNDDINEIGSTNLKLLQNGEVGYEIIKSVSSYENEYGYITTNVILSVILPSNAILVSYNAETLNTSKTVYYAKVGAQAPEYVVYQTYNPETMDYDATGYYTYKIEAITDTKAVSQTTTSVYVEYDGNLYVYDHKSGEKEGDGIHTTYYYSLVKKDSTDGSSSGDEDGSSSGVIVVLAKTVDAKGNISWSTITYTPVPEGEIEVGTAEDANGQIVPQVKIKGDIVDVYTSASEANEVSVVVTAYSTDMKQYINDIQDANDIYVYYDLKLVGNTRYYVSPIAKRTITQQSPTGDTDETAQVIVSDVLYFSEITNFEDLKSQGKIMLGEDIFTGTNDNGGYAAAFREVMGASIIQSCYYYVAPVGEANSLLLKQYINDKTNDGDTNYVTHYYYYANVNGSLTRLEYTGPVASTNVKDDNGNNIYTSSVEFYDVTGNPIDLNTYEHVINNKLYDATGTIKYYVAYNLSVTDDGWRGNYYKPSHKKVDGTINGLEENSQYAYVTNMYNAVNIYGAANPNSHESIDIRFAYTLYEISADGTPITTQLYYDGEYYYKIESSVFIEVDVGDGNIATYYAYKIDTTKGFTLNMNPYFGTPKYSDSLNNLANRLTVTEIVTEIGSRSTEVTYTQNVMDENGQITTKTMTSYNTYLIPSYFLKSGDKEIQLYQAVNKNFGSLDVQIPTLIKPVFEGVYDYTMSSTFVTSENGLVYSNGNPVRSVDGYLLDDSGNYITDISGQKVKIDEEGYITDGNGNKTLANNTELYTYVTMEAVLEIETALVRTAQTVSGNVAVTLLGKYIQTNDADNPKIYPSFSNLNAYTEEDAYTILADSDGMFDHYYSLDYTSKNVVIEGFPGVVLLSGAPYPNPVLYFSIRHKKSEEAVINLSFNIQKAYYVELMGTNIQTEDSNLIRDFTTYAFKDTLTNLSLNDYIDKTYYILDATTLKPVIPYIYNAQTGKYEPKLVDADGNPVELSIQDIGLNDGSFNLYFGDVVGANGKYLNLVYMQYTKENGSIGYKVVNYETDVLLWRSDSTKVEHVAMYDIHSYTQGLDGIIYFNSGNSTDDNAICIGLSGISSGATASSSGAFDYSEVLIAGVTNAYRTKASQLDISKNLVGYWFDKGLNVLNAYNSKDAYFLSGQESAIVIASPTVNMTDDAGVEYIYRFKEWQIYSRYNSEVLYYNRGVTESLVDRYNAILRFTSAEAGYFVILPVYERVFSIDLGTAVIDGALNQGGGINVQYKDGDEIDVNNASETELYLVNYFKTTYNNREGYYYGDITGYPFLYFTGNFDADGIPIFSHIDNVFVMDYSEEFANFSTGEVSLYFHLNVNSSGKVVSFKPLKILTGLVKDKAGLVRVNNTNGLYSFYYNTYNSANGSYSDTFIQQVFGYQTGFSLENADSSYTSGLEFSELLNYAFTANFFYDTITSKSDLSYLKTPMYYDSETKYFYSVDVSVLDSAVRNVTGENLTFTQFLIIWNFAENTHMFDNVNVFDVMGANYMARLSGVNKYVYAGSDYISVSDSVYLKSGSMLNDIVAQSFINIFMALEKVTNNPIINGMYLSNRGSLSSGELMLDEEGNLYSTQQFKQVYIDRDSYVQLVAVPDNGYRVEGWYKCIYDEETNTWYTTDEKVENSEDIYSDEILKGYYNPYNQSYYYITDYYEERSFGVIYFYDEEKSQEALVPDKMLNKVRGYFVNFGSENYPNYVQVYRKGTVGDSEYFYDQEFVNRVDLTDREVVELTYIEAINRNSSSNGLYTLSNIPVYRVVDEFGVEHFYRAKSTGNIVVEGNTLTINTLHSNIRYVAKFIETYNEYIFAEDEETSGINVLAVYYNNSDVNKLDDEEVVIRTDSFGNNKTGDCDPVVATIDKKLFRLYEDESNNTLLTTQFMSGIVEQTLSNGTTTSFARYESGSADTFNNLTSRGFSALNSIGKSYRVNAEDDESLNGKLSLRSMYFDVKTSVYIVVSVKADYELTIHSLGLNSTYTLEPIIAPTSEFISYNQAADKENKVDYLYYVFKITYDRNPENENASYIVHPERGNALAYDALAGNYLSFYSNYFAIYDNNDIRITYLLTTDKYGNQKVNLNPYLVILRNRGLISSDIYNLLHINNYDNIADGLEEISKAIKNPDAFYPAYIKKLNDEEKLSTNMQIFGAIRNIETDSGYYFKSPRLIYSGQRNFVNLSTIPVYNYTIQAVTVDAYETDLAGEFVYDENGKFVSNNSKKHNLLNQFYTSAGTNNKTYLGAGSKIDLSNPFIYVNSNYAQASQMEFNTLYMDVEYGEGGEDETLLEDIPLAENTILLLGGTAECQEGYAFVGWFEQKYDRDTGLWSEPTLMSNELVTPYLSMANADTIILAVYKKTIDVEISYNNQEMTVQMSDVTLVDANASAQDNIGKIKITTTGNITTITGTFYFDTDLNFTIIPTGGYRFDGVNYEVSDTTVISGVSAVGQIDLTNQYIKAIDANGESTVISEVSLNGVFGLSIPVKAVIEPDKQYDTLSLELSAKKIVLVYIDIENFYTTQGSLSSYTFSGFDVSLVRVSTNAVYAKTNGADKDNFLVNVNNDSTQTPIQAVLSEGHLYMYGYFDYSLSEDLVIVTQRSNSEVQLTQWYINSYTEPTNEFESLRTNVYNGLKYSEFVVTFLYPDGENAELNSNDKFALSEDNATYYARARIEATNEVVIAHSYINDINDATIAGISAGSGAFYSTDVYSLMTYNGRYYYESYGSTVFNDNGSAMVKNTNSYQFETSARINLSVNSRFILVNDQLYVFVGWFTGNYDYVQGVTQTTLLSTNMSIMNQAPSGFYEAKYVKAQKISINGNQYGQLSVGQTQDLSFNSDPTVVYGYYEDGNYYYILTGSTLVVDAYATTGYILPDFTVKTLAGVEVTEGKVVENFADYQRLTLTNIQDDLVVNANFERGYQIIINQNLYPSIDMYQDSTEIVAVMSTMTIDDNIYKTLTNTVSTGKTVTFGYDENMAGAYGYYFVGWYINGQIVSKSGQKYLTTYTQTITSDLVIEARFVPIVKVSVSGLVNGSNTSISLFSYTLTYFDMREGINRQYADSVVNSQLSLPAGSVAVLNETRSESLNGNPYTFIGWKLVNSTGTTVYQTLSTDKETSVTLTTPLLNDQGYIRIAALYTSTTTIDLYKQINIREEDKANNLVNGVFSEQFKSYFDIIVTYTDQYGASQKLQMGSKDSVTSILVMRNSTIYVSYSISGVVSDRYYLSSLTYSTSITTDITASATNAIIQLANDTSVKINAVFSPASSITISKELNGESTTSEDIEINYVFRDASNNIIQYDKVESSSVTLVVPVSSTFEITASELEGATFVGWYNFGDLISTSLTITNVDIDINNNVSLIARYVSTANVTLLRTVDGVEEANDNLGITITGNIGQEVDGEMEFIVKTLYLNSSSVSRLSDILLLTNTNFVLTATHYAGYTFVGFNINVDGNEYTASVSGGYSTVSSLLTLGACENVTITAEYKSEYSVNYQITTINGEDSESNDGGSISSQTKFVSKGDTTISFKLTINSGYSLAAIYVNGTRYGTSYTSGQTVSITLSSISSNVDVEIRFARIVQFGVRIAINGTNDGTEITNKLGISTSSLTFTVGAGTYTYDNTTGSLYRYVPNATVNGTVKLSTPESFTSNDGVTYYFDGWYVYDGVGVATSLYALTYERSVTLIMNSDIVLIAKYEESAPSYSVQTNLAFEMIDGASSVTEITNITNTVDANGLVSYNSNTYMFVGYFAKVSDMQSVKYVKLSTAYNSGNISSYSGVYTNIVGRFVKVNTINLQPAIANAVSTITYVATPLYPLNTNKALVISTSESTKLSVLSNSTVTIKNSAKSGYSVVSSYTIASVSESETQAISVSRTGVKTTVVVDSNKITSRTTSPTGTTNSVVISISNNEVNVTFAVTAGSSSTMNVGIYGSDGTYSTLVVSDSNNNIVETLTPGTVISLSFTLGLEEVFSYFRIYNGTSTSNISSVTYNYYLTSTYSDITITGDFSGGLQASIVENDINKGNASIVRTGANIYRLTVSAWNEYRIADIQMAPITNGIIGTYVSAMNSTDINNLLNYYNYANTYSGSDSDGKNYLKETTLSMSLKSSVAIKIVYGHVTNVTFEVSEASTSTKTYNFYFYEETSPLTFDKLKNFIDNLSSSSTKASLSYLPEDLKTFEYLGNVIDDTTSIDISTLSDVIIYVTSMTEVNIKMYIDVIIDTDIDYNTYNTPTDGLAVTFNGLTVSSFDNPDVFEYITSKSMAVKADDTNKYFDFEGYYNASYQTGYLVSTSSTYVFTQNDFANLTQDAEGNYIIYAVFKERLQTIFVQADYVDSNFKISVDATTLLSPTEDLQVYSFGEDGNFSYIYDAENAQVQITYPASLIASDHSFYVHAEDFDYVNASDKMLPTGVTEFYEKTVTATSAVDNIYFRFYQYVDANATKLGTTYDKVLNVKFADYIAGTTITATAKRLYMVEFAYNYYGAGITIKLNVISVNNNVMSSVLVKQVSNDVSYDTAIISYKLEEGVTATVSVDVTSIDDDHVFSTILGSTTTMLSELLSGCVLGTMSAPTTDELASPKTVTDWWADKLDGFLPTSKMHDTNADEIKFTSYSFVAQSNISFMADFYDSCLNERYHIFTLLYNPYYEGTINLTLINDYMTSLKTGNGFKFSFVLSQSAYRVDYSESSTLNFIRKENNYTTAIYRETYNDDNELNLSQQTINKGYNSSKFVGIIPVVYYNYYISGVSNTNEYMQTTLHMQMNRYTRIDFTPVRLVKTYLAQEVGDGYSLELPDTFSSALKYKTEFMDNYIGYSSSSLIYQKIGTKVKLLASMYDGYFFKGFIAISSGYESTYNARTYGGEYKYTPATNYTFLTYKMNSSNGEYVSAETEFIFNGNTAVYALYEARVYIIDLNTYEYKEDNESEYVVARDENGNVLRDESGNVVLDPEKSKMTTESIEGGLLRGSLIVERGVTAKLSSISYPYSQFVGWATTVNYDQKIKIAIDSGTGTLDYDTLRNSIYNLRYNKVYPGEYEDGKFSPYSTNNLYIYDIESDMTINLYYTYKSYKLNIELSEILSTYTYADSGKVNLSSNSQTDTYLTYADYVRSQPGWSNPSAGKYVYETHTGSNDKNATDVTTEIVIEKDDPYVYVMNDYNDVYIGYPTKVAQSLISRVLSESNKVLTYGYDKNINITSTSKKAVKVQVALANGSSGSTQTQPYTYQLDLLKDYYNNNTDYINNYLEVLYKNGYDYNQCEINSDGDFCLDNIFNYIEIETLADNSVVYRLKKNLFTIAIQGESQPLKYDSSEIPSENLSVDVDKGTIKLNFKIIAYSTGFPTVTVTMNKTPSELPDSIIPQSIKLVGYTPTTQSETSNNVQEVKGFNLGLFEGDDFLTDPEFKVDDMDVNMVIKWQQQALAIEALVNIDGTETWLTGSSSSNANLKNLKDKTREDGCESRDSEKSYVVKHEYEIEGYYIVIVKNGQLILDKLTEIANSSSINNRNVESEDKRRAKIMMEAFASAYVSLEGLANGETGSFMMRNDLSKSHPIVELLLEVLGSYSNEDVLNLLNYYYPGYNFTEDSLPNYKVIEVFDYYKKGVNFNFYNNCINSDDYVITQCILQEHSHDEYNKKYWFWDQLLWSATKGYDYFRGATMSFSSNNGDSGYSSITYDNNFANIPTDSSQVETNWFQNVGNYVTGIFNGREKYAGTYSRMLHTFLSITDEQYSKTHMTSINSVVKIDTSQEMPSALHDWSELPTNAALLSALFYGPGMALIDGILVLCGNDNTIFKWMTNLNF